MDSVHEKGKEGGVGREGKREREGEEKGGRDIKDEGGREREREKSIKDDPETGS